MNTAHTAQVEIDLLKRVIGQAHWQLDQINIPRAQEGRVMGLSERIRVMSEMWGADEAALKQIREALLVARGEVKHV